ncbi:non-hydrolyzing UDP-N-acetylglucosamine 2-epimerase [Rhabdochromatium marinum]|uniref:non-hydrolyzing UDP-N-acetylglucosamine 2-epimerase n=1 Tax=Rhabdochromatium marinum TaxID=48729 RepID=UPI001904ACDA|nr:UDP-N-acetylglucosamine 2-epimerase (non-hydrolyzing) [Rhabdochromatium marinum]
MIKILTVIGARPQFIKAAVVSRALRGQGPDVREFILHTGQHYDANMSDVFFDELDIPRPDRHLGIGGGTHGQNTGRMIEAIEAVLMAEQPDWVLVYGDTDSTLAGALAAVKLHIPVAHVEAGLRSFNRRMPEEINRILTDQVADLLFTPTASAVANLRAEGIAAERIRPVGDVMYDAALFYAERAMARSTILDRLGVMPGQYVLATVHRAENTDDPERLRAILRGLMAVARERSVVCPLHPRTRGAIERLGMLDEIGRALILCEPLGYLDMVMLERQAAVIATDSGGVQKEAFFYQVPCVVFRQETEWVELVEIGAAQLVGAEAERIQSAILLNPPEAEAGEASVAIFGEGESGQKIATALRQG